jgi:hypothetical protein
MERRKRRGREEWLRIIGDQKQSGLSAAAYCRDTGIGLGSFYQWKRRLADECGTKSVRESFIDMGRVGMSEGSLEIPELRGGSSLEVTLELGAGTRLILRRG